MGARLSHGLPPLATSGNRIIDAATGAPMLLRGVNRSGLEYSEPDEDGFASAAGLSRFEVRHIAREWRANILRIPINQDWALNGRAGRPAEDYLSDLDRVVDWAATYGAYTLLDLQWLDADNPFGANRQFVPPLPNPLTPQLWTALARRYREEPAVLFDILNEPHDRMPDDARPLHHHDGGTYPASHRRVTMAEWQPWAKLLVRSIRAEHPTALVFVSGVNWGYDLRGFPMSDTPNLVYSTHVYRNKGETRAEWREAFGRLAQTQPVFAGEWGGESADVGWGRRLAAYFQELGMGWAAWSWADNPLLVARYTPLRFGELVRASIR
jgi:hypothetical protein